MLAGSLTIVRCDALKCPAEVYIKVFDTHSGSQLSSAQLVAKLMQGLVEQGWDIDQDKHFCHLHKEGGALHKPLKPHLVKQQ